MPEQVLNQDRPEQAGPQGERRGPGKLQPASGARRFHLVRTRAVGETMPGQAGPAAPVRAASRAGANPQPGTASQPGVTSQSGKADAPGPGRRVEEVIPDAARDGPRNEPANDRLKTWLAHLGATTPGLSEVCVIEVPAEGTPGFARRVAIWARSDEGQQPEVRAASGLQRDRGPARHAHAERGRTDHRQIDPGQADARFGEHAVRARKGLARTLHDVPGMRQVALPLVQAGLPRHALVARLARTAQHPPARDLRALARAACWLRPILAALGGTLPPAQPVEQVATLGAAASPGALEALGMLVAVLEADGLEAAAAALVNRLAATLRASRVSLGLVEGGTVHVLAVAGSTMNGQRTALVQAMRGAMSEAIRQGANIPVPPEPGAPVCEDSAHRLLLREARCAAVCTLPFAHAGAVIGAVTIEWPDAAAATAAQRARSQAVLALAGPMLASLQRAQDSMLRRLRTALAERLARAFSPRRPLLKLSLLALALLLAGAALLPGTYQVAGEAVLRGSVQRVVLAPADGYIASALARPGDLVDAGDVLATLDDEPLRLELARWQAEYERLENEYREAMAQLDAPKVSVLRAEIGRVVAEYELAADTLERAQLLAPIDGVVVSGDFSQKIGAPVQRGDALFELAPLDGYRIEVRVPETEIEQVAIGQQGRLALQTRPGERLAIVVERVTPVSEVIDGRNVFDVEARLVDGVPDWLRPGMQGVARLDVGRARLLWLWTHELVDWLRIRLWRLGL